MARIPTFREVEDEAGEVLRSQGALAAVLVDLEPLARIERSFGGSAYQGLREQVDPLMHEVKDRVRDGDILTRDEREGDRFLLLLGPKREGGPFRIADLRRLTERVEEFVAPRIARLTQPYLRERSAIDVGYGFVLYSPLESPERQILRLIEDARQCADLRNHDRERERREVLLEIIHNYSVWTAFQPIVEIETRQIVGHEGLSRGPRASDLESPGALFGLAARCGVVEELERACRRQAFRDWAVFGAPGRLFLNTVPATVRDPSFLGRGVLDYLGDGQSPRFVTLEITEGQVIANLNLYREAMHPFIELGFSFAIDDVGAGYSGLETIANLGASYLKIDMGLVRDVHQKRISQQVVKAILDMAAGTGATVIAEGIQTAEEADALASLGVRYGQGYHFARPIDPYAPKMKVVAKNAAS
ncbi:MAG TPA: EAL domain-containing protein [Vicinamibacteria bacterium]|nr:EAL domain-containing protein [Vicinamibacteria bacterium]